MSDAHLGHVHLKVTDLDRAVEFYTELLDLDVTERHANYAFLSFGDHHHDLALQAHEGAASPPLQSTGLYHIAFELDSLGALGDADEWLTEREISVSPVDHGIIDILPRLKTRESRPPLGYCGLRRSLFSRCEASAL